MLYFHSIAIQPALRPFDDLDYDRMAARACGLLHCGPNK